MSIPTVLESMNIYCFMTENQYLISIECSAKISAKVNKYQSHITLESRASDTDF